MKQNKHSRRYFLQGLGGSLLALPLIPSLMPKAYAQSMGMDKFLVMIGSEHGGTGMRDWYPNGTRDLRSPLASLNTVQYLSGTPESGNDHKVRWTQLRNLLDVESSHPIADPDNGRERLSYILGSHLNPYIDKMNFYQGIDLGPGYQGHGTGMISGSISYVSNSRTYRDLPAHPSIDYFLTRHPKFYNANSDHSVGSVVFPGRPLSLGPDKSVQPSSARSTNALYNNVFSKYEGGTVDPARAKKSFLIDRVLEDYNRLVNGAYGLGRRMASEDLRKIEAHVENLFQVQKKFEVVVNSCGDVTNPGVNDWDTRLDLLVAAFNCGATRLATIFCPITTRHPSYHQDVAHQADSSPSAREIHTRDFRWQSENIVGSLVSKLDAVDKGGGQTLLDSSLVFWQHESGVVTHSGSSVNLVSFGGAGGSIQTGRFLDYRNMSNFAFSRAGQVTNRPGLLIQQWWSTVLQAMGLDASDYQYGTNRGYGPAHINTRPAYDGNANSQRYHGTRGHTAYPQRVYDLLNDKLPLV